jgi:hypothetical protein
VRQDAGEHHFSRPPTATTEADRGAIAEREVCLLEDQAPKWCELHHIVFWACGGTTSVDNGTLVCDAHHRLVHEGGWSITMSNGRPVWSPPSDARQAA